jgi:hypothetical protein
VGLEKRMGEFLVSKPSPPCLKGKDLYLERTSLSPPDHRKNKERLASRNPETQLAKTSDEFHAFIRPFISEFIFN